jgi:hypothetical protein
MQYALRLTSKRRHSLFIYMWAGVSSQVCWGMSSLNNSLTIKFFDFLAPVHAKDSKK